ncbi:MAG: hypothetical protein RJA70_1562, partial [Pseudomonadota bacterium]
MKLVGKILAAIGGLVGLAALGGGAFVWMQASAFDESMSKIYDIPLPAIERSNSPEVLARGTHLAHSIGACAMSECHGADLAGGTSIKMGPVATLTAPNITGGGLGAVYSDAELARLIQHGVKKDGRSLTFMPAHEISWLPDSDVQAIVSYLRTVPAVEKANGPLSVGLIGKVLDRKDSLMLDIARRIDHGSREIAPPPSPTKEYGRFIALGCTGCHGKTFGGGPIPGAPSDMPIPSNITPDSSGLHDYSFAE